MSKGKLPKSNCLKRSKHLSSGHRKKKEIRNKEIITRLKKEITFVSKLLRQSI